MLSATDVAIVIITDLETVVIEVFWKIETFYKSQYSKQDICAQLLGNLLVNNKVLNVDYTY